MTSVIEALTKLPRYVKLLATNGIDSDDAVVLQDNENKKKEHRCMLSRRYYARHREWILQKEKINNQKPHIKQRNREYQKRYYLEHKDELNEKTRQRYLERKNKLN